MRLFHQNESCLACPILPRVMEEGESKKAALILIGHYGNAFKNAIFGDKNVEWINGRKS